MRRLEYPVCFGCKGDALVGIVHPTAEPSDTGLIVVVGGPQYRIGSHRHFVQLGRDLAEYGVPVMRFDVRGMGDSAGDFPGFEAIDDDIEAAIDTFVRKEPHIKNVVLWGLCDGASASIFYAARDRRVSGLILLNPWIRSEASYAKTELRHYYAARFLDGSFWRRLISGEVDLRDATQSFVQRIRAVLTPTPASPDDGYCAKNIDPAAPLPDRMAQGITAFKGGILLIISGNDLTAKEFDDVTRQAGDWKQVLSANRVTRRDLKKSDHTFSREEWSQAVNRWTLEWVKGLNGSA
jgi:exosortase A-associated hydrolase 1